MTRARDMEKYSQLDQDKRAALLSLLSQDAAADPSAWQLFWQMKLARVEKTWKHCFRFLRRGFPK
jgi:hypothetical protein